MIYKISIPTKENWEQLESSLIESGYIFNAFWQGVVPIKEVKDEDGNVIVETGMNDDYAVNIITETEIPELMPYVIYKTKWHNKLAGEKDEQIVKPL